MTRWHLAQRKLLAQTLARNDWNITKAARWLGISRSTAYLLIDKWKIRDTRNAVLHFWECVALLGVQADSRQTINSLSLEQREDLLKNCRVAFNKGVRKTHPDMKGGSAEAFIELMEAWSCVKQVLK